NDGSVRVASDIPDPCIECSPTNRQIAASSSGPASVNCVPCKSSLRRYELNRMPLIAQRILIALRNIRSMHRVDHVKIPPHETIRYVRRSESAPQNRRPGVERPPRPDAPTLQFVRRHVLGRKRNPVITVPRIQPPVVIQQPPLRLQPPIQRRSRKR